MIIFKMYQNIENNSIIFLEKISTILNLFTNNVYKVKNSINNKKNYKL